MWAIGCIFGELLQTLDPDKRKPAPLFPGKTCYPLSQSQRHVNTEQLDREFRSKSHQLEKVFEVIGTPSQWAFPRGVTRSEEIEALSNEDIRGFLEKMPPMPRKDFAAMFPHADADAIELLNRMLQFDPKKRVTPKEALESSFFDGMRRPDLEVGTWARRER